MQQADAFYGSGRAYTSNVSLEHLELGNEVSAHCLLQQVLFGLTATMTQPDFYGLPRYGGTLGSSYNIFNYSSIWQSAASAVVQANTQANLTFVGPSFANNDQLGSFGVPSTLQTTYNANTSKYWAAYNTHLYSVRMLLLSSRCQLMSICLTRGSTLAMHRPMLRPVHSSARRLFAPA